MTSLDSAVALVVDDGESARRRAVVDALLLRGASVVVPVAGQTHDRLRSYEGKLTGRGDVDALFAFALEHHDAVDVVVLTGGGLADGSIIDLTEDSWSAASRTLDLLAWGMKASLTHMVPRGGGRVVVTLGAEAKVGRPGAATATVVAHAAYGLVKVAAKEAGPHGVTVNAVLSNSRADESLTGRVSEPAEVAGAVVLLGAPDSGMSGVAFPVDGGVAPY